MSRHPALRSRVLTTVVMLHDDQGADIATRGKVSRESADTDASDATALTVRVPTPELAAGREVVEATIEGTRYLVLRHDSRGGAIGSRVDWQSTSYTLRAAP